MALVKDVIERAYTKVNGEFELVAESSDDFKTYLNVLNQVMSNLAHTPYIKWQIFFNPAFNVGVIVNNTLSYVIPNMSEITIANSPFDHVYFVDGSGVIQDKYKIVDASMFQSTNNEQVCMIAGDKIYLKKTPTKIVGTTLRLPVYQDPAPYTLGSQSLVVDSVPWVVASMAAFVCDTSPVPFIARNADKYYKEAAIFMKEMRENNRRTQMLMVKALNSPTAHTWQDVMNVMTIRDL